MSESKQNGTNRRRFLKRTGAIAAATTLSALAAPPVHAAEDGTIKIALVGCGGRGGGAAVNALSVTGGPIKIVALADVFKNKVDSLYNRLSGRFGDKVDVTEERRFVGFDSYKKAMPARRNRYPSSIEWHQCSTWPSRTIRCPCSRSTR